jgi:hypothetical protein
MAVTKKALRHRVAGPEGDAADFSGASSIASALGIRPGATPGGHSLLPKWRWRYRGRQ